MEDNQQRAESREQRAESREQRAEKTSLRHREAKPWLSKGIAYWMRLPRSARN